VEPGHSLHIYQPARGIDNFLEALCARGYISPSRAKSVKICILMYLYVSYVSVIEAALNLHYEFTPLIAAGSTAGPAQP
jgi:hypothetical protein